jgi:hypothetical protein
MQSTVGPVDGAVRVQLQLLGVSLLSLLVGPKRNSGFWFGGHMNTNPQTIFSQRPLIISEKFISFSETNQECG